jgi:glucose 1-dehydrogenase
MAARPLRFEQKRVLITGADHGIGRALAQRFAAEGARMLLNTLSPVDAHGDLLAGIAAAGSGNMKAFQADVREASAIRAMFQAAQGLYGGLDVLVNNAGIDSVYPALELRQEEWDSVLNTNLRGAFLCAQEAARLMTEQEGGGVIVNISSIHDSVPRLGTAHYCASKAGLTMLTKALALEWAEYGIRVVGISPGAIETPINREEIEKVGRVNFEQWIPA